MSNKFHIPQREYATATNASRRRTITARIWERVKFGLTVHELLRQVHRFTGLRIYAYFVFVGDVDSQELQHPSMEGVQFRALKQQDMMSIARFPLSGEPSAKAASFAARLKNSLGFGAFIDDEPVAFCWADLRECCVPVANAVLLDLGPGEATAYDFYVLPEFRGRRIGPALRQAMYEELARQGRSRTYRMVSIFNAPSLRVSARSRARKLETRFFFGFPKLLACDVRIGGRRDELRTKRLLVITRTGVKARQSPPSAPNGGGQSA